MAAGGGVRRKLIVGAAAVLTVALAWVVPTPSASADTTLVDYTSDLPSGATGLLAGLIPDTIPIDDLEVTVVDTPDPVVQGQPVHYDLDVPFPDLTGELPDFGFPLGYFYIKSVDITQPIPAGVNLASVTASLSPAVSWASVSKVGSNLVVHVQSPVPGSRIRVNPDVTPATIEIEDAPGHWIPLDFIPSLDIDAVADGAPGSSIEWRSPSLLAKVKYDISVFLLLEVHWNDVDTPCTPNDPSQVVVSTDIVAAAPGLSVTAEADETSVVAGETIHYHLTVSNTGNVPLTGVGLSGADAPDCDGPVGDLAVGGSEVVDCSYTTTAGDGGTTFTNTVTADSDQTGPVASNTVSVDVDPVVTAVGGTVTAAGTGDPVAGAFVAVLRSNDFTIAGGSTADGQGDYLAEVDPGEYYVYVIDPAGRHTAGFFGAPTTVTVGNGAVADADPVLASSRGTISGTITEDGSGDPIAGAWAVTLDANTGRPGPAAVAGADGSYEIDDLTVGDRLIVFLDPSGQHQPEFHQDSPGPGGAQAVSVQAGSTADVDASLAGAPGAGEGVTAAGLTGTVTETGTGTPIAGAGVVALHAATYGIAQAGTADANGTYAIDLAPGDYKLEFLDPTGGHDMEWYDDLPFSGIGEADSVTVIEAGPNVVDADLDPATGSVSGTVTDDPSGDPIEGAWAIAIGTGGISGGAATGPDGSYVIPGLTVGQYRITFVDPPGGRLQEYWDDSLDYNGSTPFAVTSGATTSGIDAALAAP